jgi:hypothetical protein
MPMNSHTLMIRMQTGTATLEDSLVAHIKLNILLPFDTEITIFSVLRTYVYMKTCMYIFIASLIIINKTWK